MPTEERERDVTLREYLDVITKRWLVIVVSVVVVAVTSLVFIPQAGRVYKATAYVVVEGTPGDLYLMESIKRFVKSPVLINETVRLMRFKKAEALKGKGEMTDWDALSVTKEDLRQNVIAKSEDDILHISVLAESPAKSMHIANAAAKVVVEKSLKEISSGPQASLRYVERQIDILKHKLEETRAALDRHTAELGPGELLLPEEESELGKLQQEFINTKLERQMSEAQLKVMEDKYSLQKDEEILFSLVSESAELKKIRDKLAAMEKERSALLVQFTEEHPNVVAIQRDIDSIKVSIKEEIMRPLKDLKSQIGKAVTKEDTLKKIMETRFPVGERAKKRDEGSSRIPALMRELKMHQKTYARLQEEKEKLHLNTILDATKVRVLRMATEPKDPEKPQGPPAILVAITLGLVLGITAAFMQENMDTSLKTVEDVEYYTNQPIIGVIPIIRANPKKSE